MASVQDLKRRIRSVRNTRKITKAMELVASARLRRAQARIEAMRPYADRMLELMAVVSRASESVGAQPLLERREERTVAILPLTGDRGLAGAFNGQILRRSFALERQLRAEGHEVRWLVAGKKGRSTLAFRGHEVATAWTGFSDRPRYGDAQAIARRLADLYTAGEVDRVVLVYNNFVSALVQRVVEQEVLPVSEHILLHGDEGGAAAGNDGGATPSDAPGSRADLVFEPEPELMLDRLLRIYLETEIYRALLESAASEQGARMTAMRNASKNAGELIDRLTLEMNRARQAEITQEILEVVAGADALST